MRQAARNSGWTPRHSSHPYWASPARTLGDIQSPSKPWLRNALTAVHPQPSPHPTGLDPDSHWPLSPTQPLLLGPSPLTARISPVAAPGTGARPRTASLRSRSGLEQAGQHPEVLSAKGGELGRAACSSRGHAKWRGVARGDRPAQAEQERVGQKQRPSPPTGAQPVGSQSLRHSDRMLWTQDN